VKLLYWKRSAYLIHMLPPSGERGAPEYEQFKR